MLIAVIILGWLLLMSLILIVIFGIEDRFSSEEWIASILFIFAFPIWVITKVIFKINMYRWLLCISLIALIVATFTSGTVSEILMTVGVIVGEIFIWINDDHIENLNHKIETLEEQIKEKDNNGKIH